jgi:hypothetical protein
VDRDCKRPQCFRISPRDAEVMKSVTWRICVAVSLLCGTLGSPTYADVPAAAQTLSSEQAQARQFGIFVGGTATQYDLCVKKGFLAKSDQSAEDSAKAIFEKMRANNVGSDQSAFVQDGWDLIKKEIAGHESFFTKEKCSWVGKEWAKILTTMRAQ